MSVVLVILKWIGILIGGILGLVLLLAAMILLVPVRYYMTGSNQDTFIYSYRISWLLHLVSIRKKKNSDAVRLYVLGIPVCRLSGDNKKEKTAKMSEKKSEGEKTAGEEMADKEHTSEEKTVSDKKRTKKKVRDLSNPSRAKKKTGKKKSFSFEGLSSIIKFIRDSDNRRAFRKLRRELWLLIRYLSPSKVKGEFMIGTGDPCTTGLLIGGISLFPFAYQEGIHIVPDFEEKVFRADGYLKGRIRVLYLLRLLIRVYKDKELRRLWNESVPWRQFE